MKKITSLFARNYDGDRRIRNEVLPDAEWVATGEGVATRKFDGTCCRVQNGVLWKRYEVKKGKTAPDGFEAANDPDPATGKQQGWVPAGQGAEDQWHREAFTNQADGTYELCGPKIQSNPEAFTKHVLIPHGNETLEDAPRDYEAIRSYLDQRKIEGIVWHHPDGRMVKIKKRDFPQ